jgi:Zn-dependent M28 family amino/carboxypeptidase
LPIVKDSLKGDSFIQPFYIKRYFLEQYSVIHAPKTQHIKGRGVIPTENVLGFIEGTDRKDEVVVITAHYDHLGKDQGKVYNGADDDGSGTSTILALATAFAEAQKAGYKPSRSILLMTVAGEEWDY